MFGVFLRIHHTWTRLNRPFIEYPGTPRASGQPVAFNSITEGYRRMAKRNLGKSSAFLLTGALLLGVAAVSVAIGPTVGAASTSNTIVISNFMFKPMTLKVAPGATIKVTNKDKVVHTIDANGGQFNTGNISPGQTKSFKAPKKPGKYHYFCAVHTFMKGTIVVK
jgi:plastocyanin